MNTDNMTKDDLSRARQELERRNAVSRVNGFETEWCEAWVWQYYHPDGVRGRQIYRSYSDEELLDILIPVMDQPGHKPQFDRVHHIYKLYLTRRFQDLRRAKDKARARRKALEQQAKWPPDWPEAVSSEPVYRRIGEQGKEITEQDRAAIESLCEQVRQTRLPPELSDPVCQPLKKYCGIKKALEMMNIPALNKTERRFMLRYWQKKRTS
ncbi:MAG: hypothetical protein MSB10_02845 [Clostridiales bacterium]|uniref:hypothetical protein n=1 Tax=Flavonifractor porci TaxID=3133422 RepID=UPI0030B2B811|nr:hypothetical protein [Clostridiales bacterium]